MSLTMKENQNTKRSGVKQRSAAGTIGKEVGHGL
jgi:hypothetical protein